MSTWGRVFAFGLALAAAGCVPGRGSAPVPQGESYLILAEELKATNRLNLYDALRQVRPFWFTPDRHGGSTGQGVSVYLDEQLIGGPSVLSRLSTEHVQRVRYIRASEAQLRFGSINGLRPAILVESQRP